ncbi:hypothetical protein SJ954_02040 [Enterococcus faecium]|uniref:hypothetical protein n=1 Tax=Enterococcus faecium TaxID=1352 RepID=UPI00309E33B3
MGDEKKRLEVQLREAYGRVTYTYTTHLKQADNIISDNKILTELGRSRPSSIGG